MMPRPAAFLLAALLLLARPAALRADGPTSTSSALLPTIAAERAAAGLGPLIVDPALERVAMDRMHYLYSKSTPASTAISHCVDVRDDEGCHTSGYAAARELPPNIWWGENLALITGGPGGATVDDDADRAWALRLWWASPPHRANTLGRHFRRIGTAELAMPSGAVEYVEVFA